MKLNQWIAVMMTVAGLTGFLTVAGCRTAQPYFPPGSTPAPAQTAPRPSSPQTPVPAPEPINLSLSSPLSLEEAIGIALRHNPDHAMAWQRILQSESIKRQSRAAFYPSIGFFTEYSQGDSPSGYLFKKIDQRLLPPAVNFNDPGWFENVEIGLTGRFNLYNGGRDVLNQDMAQLAVDMARTDRQGVENVLVASVINSYYDVLTAKEFIRIAEESVSTVESRLKAMTVRFSAGGALKSDMLSLEVRLAQVREDVLRSQNRYETALAILTTVLGVSPAQPAAMLASPDLTSADIPKNYTEALAYAMAHRPELIKIKKQVIQSKMAVAMSKTAYLPRVDLVARYYLDDPGVNFNTQRDNWTLGLLLNWDLFTGFSTAAEIQKTTAIFGEIMEADRKTMLSVTLDVKTACLKLSEARARYTVAQASVAAAEESLRLVNIQHEGGSATITRYLEAELDRNQARIRATAAYYDTAKAISETGRATGYWTEGMRTEDKRDED